MRLNHVPARTGLLWVQLGMRTFARQPLALAGLFFLFMMVVSVLAMVPWVGQALALALLPAATLGLMAATRDAHSGQFPMPAVLASAFRAGRSRLRAILTLGALYALGSFVVTALSALLTGGEPVPAAGEANEVGAALLNQPEMVRHLLVNTVLYLPLGLLFWHAPALVHWHGIAPVKSLFFSALACWTNRAALLVYFLAWSGVFLGVSLTVVLLASALGGPEVLGAIVFPMAMLMSAMFFSSLYFTFRDSFVTDDGQAPA